MAVSLTPSDSILSNYVSRELVTSPLHGISSWETSLNPPSPFNEEFYLLGYNTVYSVISQKLELFIMATLRTSNSTLQLMFLISLEASPEAENEGLKQPALL
jgi:hypothetical protein